MNISRNPARSRPLSANVKRLMRMAREEPLNPAVEKIEREFSTRDLAYCDMQGNIFMAAVDRGLRMSDFAPIFMNSQLAGVIDYSFSRAGGMEEDKISNYLRMPLLIKSPAIIVDTVLWLNEIVNRTDPDMSLNVAVVNALSKDETEPADRPAHDRQGGDTSDGDRSDGDRSDGDRSGGDRLGGERGDGDRPTHDTPDGDKPDGSEETAPLGIVQDGENPGGADEIDIKTLTDDYEYAYWLGYIYRCECHMHDESSRMVYGAFNEALMRDYYENLALDENTTLAECALEICRRMDMMLVGKMWKKDAGEAKDAAGEEREEETVIPGEADT